ncbi:MAG: TIR domain-containing protein [Chloroflexi bacterium]|nr:MAG: TIR domain-containing protein [Chloroflexota bacterium]
MANAYTKIFKRIFPSYSRRDAPFIEAYQDLYSAREFEFIAKVIKAREGRNFNQDIQQMIADAEIFQLFWSSQAHHSGYVLSELKYALQCKRSEDFIRPIYWEVPLVSVPEQLASYHFTYLPKYAFS